MRIVAILCRKKSDKRECEALRVPRTKVKSYRECPCPRTTPDISCLIPESNIK